MPEEVLIHHRTFVSKDSFATFIISRNLTVTLFFPIFLSNVVTKEVFPPQILL